MLARNPKTGAPIRILRSEASLSRKRKTLVWLQDQDPKIKWERWDTVCVGQEHIQRWEGQGKEVDFFLLLESDDKTVEYFLSLDNHNYKMMFITKQMVMNIGWQKFKSLQLFNAIVMEEAHLMYPFLGEAWNGSPEDGILMIAAILRMSYLVGMPDGWTSKRHTLLKDQEMNITFSNETPMPLWYITQYYKPEKAKRGREIKKCLEENNKCQVIDKFVLLNEKDFSDDFPKSDKIEQHIVGKRLTYKMVVEWVYQNVPDNVIVVFGNADIYLDDKSWRDIWSLELDNVFLALLRWDVQEGNEPSKLFGPRNDSQDTWGFLSNSVKSKNWDYDSLDFPFGKAGCDNAITVEMLRKKFLIVNPSISIKTHHLQLTNYRTYDPQAIVDKPTYMYVDPTGIHDMEPVYNLAPYLHEKITYGSFDRRVRGTKPKALDVYCKMLERGERYTWKANAANTYTRETVQLLKYTNSFQTPQGLAYGYNKIFVGKDEIGKEAWSKSQLSPIHPAYESERCYAIPWNEEYATIPESYVIKFLPKVFLFMERYGKGEFFAPEKGVVPFLECFHWKESNVPLLTHKENVQIWCKELIQYPLTTQSEVHKEDVILLRKFLKEGWKSKALAKKWVVIIDGKFITNEMVRQWEEEYPDYEWAVIYDGRTAPDRVLEKMVEAAGCIFYGGTNSISRWGMTWALPENSVMIEVQNEMDPDGEACHLAGAANVIYSLIVVPRASEVITREMISKEVSNMMKASVSVGLSKPTIYMPRRSLTGFFSHAGDSFREMVELWAERQYVDAIEDSKAVQIWLNGVGKILLYDRPTMDWLFAAPQEEQTWELALFGNPKPSESGGPAKSWFFWPRRPRLVEECVTKGIPKTRYQDRSKQMVFYGKIENKVQEKRRKAHDWSSVCDEFVMVNGETTSYKYTQQEYLEQLAKAKFGLCLAGFGKKCHREVECMAMGCVPVCAADVDMDNYANPLQEGVHYIRVENPEDAKQKVEAITEEQWNRMSAACIQWWQDNCSAEGSWKLTQSLL